MKTFNDFINNNTSLSNVYLRSVLVLCVIYPILYAFLPDWGLTISGLLQISISSGLDFFGTLILLAATVLLFQFADSKIRQMQAHYAVMIYVVIFFSFLAIMFF